MGMFDDRVWEGIERSVSAERLADTPSACEQFLADLEAGVQRVRSSYGGPPIEYHNPQCPKFLTKGEKACRCGAAPIEGIFEDELERMSASKKMGR